MKNSSHFTKRDFGAANNFNVRTNFLSGNVFPLSEEATTLSLASLVWITFVWLARVTYIATVAAGSLHFANLTTEEAFKKSGAAFTVSFELIIPTIYLNFRRKDLRKLIRKFGLVPIDTDESRKCIRETLAPYKRGLEFYVMVCSLTACAWCAAPAFLLFDNNSFTYADYAAPAYFPGEPFNRLTFLPGLFLQIVGGSFVSLGKISVDIYITCLISLLSGHYRFLRSRLAFVLGGERNDKTIPNSLRDCVRCHATLIQIGSKLTEILAFHIGATYVMSIMKLCFLGFGIITFQSANIEKAAYFVYALACIAQLFLLCSCIHQLLDESTSVTSDAFHENWHAHGIVIKKMFCMMKMGDQIECRLSAYRIVDLVVPTLGSIVSKSYSVCLLLLKVN